MREIESGATFGVTPPVDAMFSSNLRCQSAGLLLLHALGRTSARLGGAAESRVVAAGLATMLELGDVALGEANDSQGRFAAGARMGADEFGRLT